MTNRLFLSLALASAPLMAGCGKKADDSAIANTTSTDAALASSTAAVQQSQTKIDEINGGMAALQRHHAEDPVKMDRLISECQSETGAVMQGAGAMQITNCVNGKW